MTYARKIILHAPPWNSPLLEEFVDACIRDNVSIICVVGEDCERVHDVIDEIIVAIALGLTVVGDGASRALAANSDNPMTSWHTGQTADEVRAFLEEEWVVEGDEAAKVQEVMLRPE